MKICVSELKKQGMYDVVNAFSLNELSKELEEDRMTRTG